MPFEFARRIRFQDADPAGIVFFAHVLSFCHEAYEELLRAGGLPIESLLAPGSAVYPLRHAEVDFTGPMRIGMRIGIFVQVTKLGERSFTMGYDIRDEAGAPLATASTVHVAVERQAMKAVPIGASMRALLERHLATPA